MKALCMILALAFALVGNAEARGHSHSHKSHIKGSGHRPRAFHNTF